jgi:putative FmdB family regulatory protein
MPTYQYRCQACKGEFEVRQSFTDDAVTTCPDGECAGPVNKVFSGVGISFKGDGFYKNDHGAAAKGLSSEKAASSTGSPDKTSPDKTSPDKTSPDRASSDTSTSGEGSSRTKDASSSGSTSDSKAGSSGPRAPSPA